MSVTSSSARATKKAHVFDARFNARVAVISFALGACIELFMIKTGFYDKCARRRRRGPPTPTVQAAAAAALPPTGSPR